jgi:hypothetical protein
MTTRTILTGRYRLLNKAFLQEKANRDDPRRPFYAAILANETYEAYLAEVGQKEVLVEGYKTGPISGRMEILYCRRKHWIADAWRSAHCGLWPWTINRLYLPALR